MDADLSLREVLEEPGPWQHRHVNAGGATFHVVDAGPLECDHAVVLLHEFPLFWRSWRHVIPSLADQGHRVIAVDQRGFGASDLQADKVDLLQLSHDVTAIMSAMGISHFTVVGAGMGGAVAWMLGATNPVALRAVMTLAAPHPLERTLWPTLLPLWRGRLLALRMDIPWRRVTLLKSGKLIDSMIRSWAAPSHREQMLADAQPYRRAMDRAFAASATTDSFSSTRFLSIASRKALADPVQVPTLSVHCAEDSSLSATDFARDSHHVTYPLHTTMLPAVGHFAPEEAPERVTTLISDFLASLPTT